MSYLLREFDAPPADWDRRIEALQGKTVFHELAWHRHVASIHPSARFRYFEILDGSESVGYFSGVVIWKGPVRVLGSPLPGTGTNYGGPVLKPGADPVQAIQAILRFCRRHLIMHVEMASEFIPESAFAEAGMERHRGVTHFCPLPDNEDAAFAALRSTCRNRVRKAQNSGLVALVSDDPGMVDQFYAQYCEVYGNQGLAMPFGIDRPRSLFKELFPVGRLLPVVVMYEGENIASGLFPFDDHCIYFWGAVSWEKHRALCPNELLHWTVIREAVQRGIPGYNMCGGKSQFKDKFGGEDIPYNHYSRSFLPLLGNARDLYKKWHYKWLKYKGRKLQASPGS